MKSKTVFIFGGSFLFFTSIAILTGKGPLKKQDEGLSIFEYCEKYGYKIQNETLVTEDGFILTLHRLRCFGNVTNCKHRKRKPPILLMHGLLGSSADFVAAGTNQSLAFKLADLGYDVWLGNKRGNTYSREHIKLDADNNSSFWNFSFHEIGIIDIPAMIDHIVSNTNFSKISYVGMSQGCVSYLVMTTSKPEYNDKILVSNVIAPVTTLYDTKNVVFRTLQTFNFIIEPTLIRTGHVELGGNNQIVTKFTRYLCNGPHIVGNWLCTEFMLKYVVGCSDQLNYDIIPFHMSISSAGISSKQLQHFVQNRITGQFTHYDYYDKNEEYYNQATPPIYNLSKITAPLAVYYSAGDVFTNVKRLHQELKTIPNVVLKYKVPYDDFNHLDFIYSKNINAHVNDKVIETINKYNKNY